MDLHGVRTPRTSVYLWVEFYGNIALDANDCDAIADIRAGKSRLFIT